MTRRLTIYTAVFTAGLVLSCRSTRSAPTPRASSDEDAVRRVEEEAAAAYDRNDVHALDRLWAADYLFVNPAGIVLDKAQRLETLRTGNLRIESYHVDQMRLRVLGTTAIVVFRSSLAGSRGGNDISSQRRVTTVLVKRDGRWQIVAQQSTPILR